MKMIVGGAFQGKTECAKRLFGMNDCDIIDGGSCSINGAFDSICIKNYNELIKRLIAEEISPAEYTERLFRENSGVIIIMNEIGCGIVPIEKSERILREETGRTGCMIAEKSDAVIRVICGIPSVIKGEINED